MRRLTLAATAAIAIAAAAPPAGARQVDLAVRGVAFCATKDVRVRLEGGGTELRRHVEPGRRITTVRRSTRDFLLHVRIGAPWSEVQRGQRLRVRADGPGGERWEWRVRLYDDRPLRDRTDYQACLRLKTRTGRFLTLMQRKKGAWRFSLRITDGSLVRSRGAVTIRSR